jgi:hypothetical protein
MHSAQAPDSYETHLLSNVFARPGVDCENPIEGRIRWSFDQLGQAARTMFGVILAVLRIPNAAFRPRHQMPPHNLAVHFGAFA